MTTFQARYLFPVAGPVLANGLLTISEGRITAVESAGSRTPDVDLGNAAIIPGLVNAHTHLDLTHTKHQFLPRPDQPFVDWLGQVISSRRHSNPETIQQGIQAGILESLNSGVTLLADISSDGASATALSAAKLTSVVFLELLGLTEERAEQAKHRGLDWLQQEPTPHLHRALSPHAPYSVHRQLFQNWPSSATLMTHFAESREEMELIDFQSGPMVPFLQQLGVWNPAGLATWPDFRSMFAAEHRWLLAHGNYLPEPLWQHLGRNSSIVYCPRTHAAFGHSTYPLQTYLEHGLRVCFGTDSLASNPDLDILNEAAFAWQCHPTVSGAQILRMATLAGAEALGLEQETGSLEVGKWADLVVVPLPNEGPDDPYQLVFHKLAANAKRRTCWHGIWRN